MDNTITVQEFKTGGEKSLQKKMKQFPDVFMTVRGEKKYVIMPIAEYDLLKNFELDHAISTTQEELKTKKYKVMTLKEHINDLKHV